MGRVSQSCDRHVPELPDMTSKTQKLKLLAAVVAVMGCAYPPLEERKWLEVETPNFRVLSDAGERQALVVARDMEAFHYAMKHVLEPERFDGLVPNYFYLFRDWSDYQRYSPSNVEGLFVQREDANYMVLQAFGGSGRLRRNVFHEYLHYLDRNNGAPRKPVWYREGLAEFLSSARVRGRTLEMGSPWEPAYLADQRDPEGGWTLAIPLRDLLTATTIGDTHAERRNFYIESWVLTHYLWLGVNGTDVERKDRLDCYLERVRIGGEPERVFRDSFGATFGETERALVDYVALKKLPRRNIELPGPPPPSAARVRVLSGVEVRSRLADLDVQLRRGQARWARSQLDSALAESPDHVPSLATLGRLQSWEDHDAANETFQHALRLAPEDPRLHLYHADHLLGWALDLQATGGDDDAGESHRLRVAARQHYETFTRLRPELAAGYRGVGLTYFLWKADAGAGVEWFEKARRRRPTDDQTALVLGVLYERTGEIDLATDLYAEVARWAASSALRDQAQQLRDQAQQLLDNAEAVRGTAHPDTLGSSQQLLSDDAADRGSDARSEGVCHSESTQRGSTPPPE